jgi:hypothetical protein
MSSKPLFDLGRILITPAALSALIHTDVLAALRRHQVGEWGEVCPEDARANRRAIMEGSRLVSVYHSNGVKFWIITEADRSVSTVLLPEDY